MSIKIGIVGATGYTGVELLRLLAHHPQAGITTVTSRHEAGRKIVDYFPNLRGTYDYLTFLSPEQADLHTCDVVFFATPNGVAMHEAPELLEQGVKVIDLAADYRLQDLEQWQHWYKQEHASPEWVSKAIYGLPELNHSAIAQANLIANPGCYPTCVLLPLLPLLQKHSLQTDKPLIADCKSAISGSGRQASINNLFTESADNIKAYAVAGHRHFPEIKQILNQLQPHSGDNFVFVPHLTPLIRGMHATIYIQPKSEISPDQIIKEYYQNSAFVDVLPAGRLPETRSVRGANFCRIHVQQAPDSSSWILCSVIDNLVKGAAGQAIQNMNIMFGLDQSFGLVNIPLLP